MEEWAEDLNRDRPPKGEPPPPQHTDSGWDAQAPCGFTGFRKVEEPEPNTAGGSKVGVGGGRRVGGRGGSVGEGEETEMGRGQRDTSKPRPVPAFPPPVALGKCRAPWLAERQWRGTPLFSCRVPRAEPGSYKALYNSQLRFRHRLYADLETVPYHVHLSRPLAQLVKHAVLYVRNTVPRQVFQALSRCGPARPVPRRPARSAGGLRKCAADRGQPNPNHSCAC